jgi:hypothetical protein
LPRVVRQQAEVGIDVVSDGEFGKSISSSLFRSAKYAASL